MGAAIATVSTKELWRENHSCFGALGSVLLISCQETTK